MRKTLAELIYPQTPTALPPPTPVGPVTAPSPPGVIPPKETVIIRKDDSQLDVREVPGEQRLGLQPPDYLPPESGRPQQPPQPKTIFRVRRTDALTDKPFGWLPFRAAPDPEAPKVCELSPGTICNLSPGTGGLIPTGRIHSVRQGDSRGSGTGKMVDWIEVEFEGQVGWVSKPYVEQDLNASR